MEQPESKVECTTCRGTGRHEYPLNIFNHPDPGKCRSCDGEGVVEYDEEDFKRLDVVNCPYCGRLQDELSGDGGFNDEEEYKATCYAPACKKEFTYSPSVSISWSSWRVDG